ncbi:hypothetical protein F751_3795 [Auxenochlorella protothecoides]|uniref:Uncharacterized protein n=1 Tax=Auxenochlorella protothecoides TaxID=3075 RepID=A0A087SGC9_AUXPR|nr:hypothetical protein F751_3795 [Auxenochlorella protothecoides]KFM24783.1 hypothetical protein F751_3795 [Auxenochlorella protothecoides]
MVTARQLGGTDSQGVSAQLATLMRYPKPARLHLTPRLVPQLVARGRQTHDPSQEAVGALAARLKLLLFVLEDCSRYLGAVQQSRVPLVNETEWKTVHHVYGALLQVWVDVQNEERRLEEEAALVFKTKAKAVTLSIDEQEDEDAYNQQFPDHRLAFADLELDHDVADAPDEVSGPEQKAAFALVGTLKGHVLERLAAAYAALFASRREVVAAGRSPAAFLSAYQLGLQIAGGDSTFDSSLDRETFTGHITAVAQEFHTLAKPASHEADVETFDIQSPSSEEALLIRAPVAALQRHLLELLAEWPEHVLLVQAWFSLYELLIRTAKGELQAEFDTVIVELQTLFETSPIGEFADRLALLHSFMGHLNVLDQSASGGAPAQTSRAGMYRTILLNVHGYYSQFAEVIAAKISEELKPQEKQLKQAMTKRSAALVAHFENFISTLAERTAQLRADTARGHISRKRLALKDLFDAISEIGISKSEIAVPAQNRGVFCSFIQAFPEVAGEDGTKISNLVETINEYYYKSILRMKKVDEVRMVLKVGLFSVWQKQSITRP